MGFVDLHAHVLPALDDGVKSVGEAVEVVAMLGRLGFETICCTPHQKVGSWVPSTDSISKARAEVVAALTTGSVGVELRLGAENFWDELFMQRCVDGEVPAYTGERAFLFEIAPVNPPAARGKAFRFARVRLLPVMAHPERIARWDVTRAHRGHRLAPPRWSSTWRRSTVRMGRHACERRAGSSKTVWRTRAPPTRTRRRRARGRRRDRMDAKASGRRRR